MTVYQEVYQQFPRSKSQNIDVGSHMKYDVPIAGPGQALHEEKMPAGPEAVQYIVQSYVPFGNG